MTQQPPDDFERRLRDVLHSRGLGVPVPPDAIDRIHAGARRRQQRRSGASALGAVAIIAIAAVAIGVRPHGHASNVAGTLRTASPSPTVAAASSASLAPRLFGAASAPVPASAAPLSSAVPIAPRLQPLASGSVAASRPGGFVPMSVSAVGLNDYWVLGYTERSDGGLLDTVIRTTDGGHQFTTVGSPDAALASTRTTPLDPPASSEIRFGDTDNGWAFGGYTVGGVLFQTTDAGTSWSAVKGIPGAITDLVAANHEAWAIVQSNSGATYQYALWSTSYGATTQAWAPVALPFELGSTTPSIVDQDGTVTVMASGPSSAGNKVHVLIGTAGKPFTDHAGPCEQDIGGTLSNSKKAIWVECQSGTRATLYVSKDSGATWTPSPTNNTAKIEVEAGVAIGAIDDTSAVIFDAANQRLSKISGSTVTPASGALISDVIFLGFTTPTAGFAITVGENAGANQLLRTTDGGATWPAVTF